ncbi:hypothetical protein D1872_240370 [compost metagenome]
MLILQNGFHVLQAIIGFQYRTLDQNLILLHLQQILFHSLLFFLYLLKFLLYLMEFLFHPLLLLLYPLEFLLHSLLFCFDTFQALIHGYQFRSNYRLQQLFKIIVHGTPLLKT